MSQQSDQGVTPPGSGHSAEPEPCSTVSAETASVPNATDFITFTARGGHGEYTVKLRQPVPLYDETHRGYRVARATARRHLRRELGLHPCAKLAVEPYDWSDAIDAYTAEHMS